MDEKAVAEAVVQGSVPSLKKCAAVVEKQAKNITKKGGRVKTAGGRTKKGQFKKQYKSVASPVGQPPHKQTGALSNSITWVLTNQGTAIVGPTTVAWYGAIHEHSKQFPRPFMVPALDHERPMFPRFYANMKLAQTPAGRRLNRGSGRKRAR